MAKSRRLLLILIEDGEDGALLLIRHLKNDGLNPVAGGAEMAGCS